MVPQVLGSSLSESMVFVSSVSVIRPVAGVFILSLSPTHTVARVCDWFEN